MFLGAVGSGTSIANVQVYSTLDDGIQLAGGAVTLSNVAVLYARDDSLDVDEGYNGSLSNLLLIQDQFSGDQCFAVDGIADFETLTATDSEDIINQGINSQVVVDNLTCVASGVPTDSGDGAGVRVGNAGFLTMSDSLVVLPGSDDFLATNHCIQINDRSLQAVDDGDLSVTGTVFSCPDKTGGNFLPVSTVSTEDFLVGAGNQFAILSRTAPNPPPVASAGNGQNLLEGAPLIYSPLVADVLVNGAVPTANPTTFFGAVQQGGDDWTLDWTFGLHPGMRFRPVWYESPIVITPDFVPASKGQVVTLDAAQSVGQAPGLTFQWTQVDFGDAITFSNPTDATTQFTAPGVGTNLTEDGGFVEVEVTVTDVNGLEAARRVNIPIGPSIPSEFYSATESIIPVTFGNSIEDGVRISIDTSTNTGFYKSVDGETPFTWTDTDTTFRIDFSANPLVGQPITSFEELDGDPQNGPEEITRTTSIEQLLYTLVSDDGPKKVFQLAKTGADAIFDVATNTPLPPEGFTDSVVQSSNQAVVALDNGIIYNFEDGDVVTLPVNLSTAVGTLFNPDVLLPDLLTFNSDGTGSSQGKAVGFSWFTSSSQLNISFFDGESAEYTLLFDNDNFDAVGVTYTKTDSSTISQVLGSVRGNALVNFANQPQIAGIYETRQRVELDDGTFAEEKVLYRLHPDGTGQLELESIDTATGELGNFFVSGNGICWQLEGTNDLIWSRTVAPDDVFIGSRIPNTSTCSLLNTAAPDNTLINFRRDITLLDVSSAGRLLTHTESRNNQFDPVAMTGDNNILELTSTFLRNFEAVVPFNGNPPLAVPDEITVFGVGSPETISPTSNDLDGDSPIVPTSIVIEVQPKHGTVVVEPNGDLTYTADPSFTDFDVFFYRVFDMNNNSSTIGEVEVIEFDPQV